MTIGLIAHDAKKKLMQNFCIAYRGILSIPLATNLASAELLIKALDRGDMEWREVIR